MHISRGKKSTDLTRQVKEIQSLEAEEGDEEREPRMEAEGRRNIHGGIARVTQDKKRRGGKR